MVKIKPYDKYAEMTAKNLAEITDEGKLRWKKEKILDGYSAEIGGYAIIIYRRPNGEIFMRIKFGNRLAASPVVEYRGAEIETLLKSVWKSENGKKSVLDSLYNKIRNKIKT